MMEMNLNMVLTDILRKFKSSTPSILGAAVISTDGFTIASELPTSVEERRVAAMAAAMLGLGEQTTDEFEHGYFKRVFVEGSEGYTVIMSAGNEAVLSAIVSRDAKMGLVFLQMGRTAEAIGKAIAQ